MNLLDSIILRTTHALMALSVYGAYYIGTLQG